VNLGEPANFVRGDTARLHIHPCIDRKPEQKQGSQNAFFERLVFFFRPAMGQRLVVPVGERIPYDIEGKEVKTGMVWG
jgi:hypothetical protein